MGKRSSFARKAHDDYPTPPEALMPLVRFLDSRAIIDPCPGEGLLVKHLKNVGFRVKGIRGDARYSCYPAGDIFVTNPPWTLEVLEPIIVNLSDQATTWLLLWADFAHLQIAGELRSRLHSVVSVGRVKWFPESRFMSLDNAAWYRFERPGKRSFARFYGRG